MNKYQITLQYQIEADDLIAAITKAASGKEKPQSVAQSREIPQRPELPARPAAPAAPAK